MSSEFKQIIEALVFASDFPLSTKKIAQIIDDLPEEEVQVVLDDLFEEYKNSDRGIVLQNIAGGYEFATNPETSLWVSRLMAGRRKNRLTRAGLETCSIIAYHQPVNRGDIERIRGVDCGGPIRTLLERNIIVIAGREKAPGRPLIYKTSDEFLRYFGVESLKDLPRLEEIEEIIQHGGKPESFALEQLSIESGDSGQTEEQPAD